MANNLRVDPTAVQAAADGIDVAGDGLRSAHAAVHERITAAAAGWVGTSGAALSAARARWEEESAAHYTELIGHAAKYRSAATSYTTTDDGEAADVQATAAAMDI
jgi:WXG100 family type VII secretion target